MVLCEFFGLQAREGTGQSAIDAFQEFERASAKAAAAANWPASLGVDAYAHVEGSPDQAYLFVYWETRDHHDDLMKLPTFEPAKDVLLNSFLPKVKAPPNPFWVKVARANELKASNLAFLHVRPLPGSQKPLEDLVAELPTDLGSGLESSQLSFHALEGTQDEFAIFVRSDSKEQLLNATSGSSALLRHLSTICTVVSSARLS